MFQCLVLDQISPVPEGIMAEVAVFVAVVVHVLKLLFLGIKSAIAAAAAVLLGHVGQMMLGVF